MRIWPLSSPAVLLGALGILVAPHANAQQAATTQAPSDHQHSAAASGAATPAAAATLPASAAAPTAPPTVTTTTATTSAAPAAPKVGEPASQPSAAPPAAGAAAATKAPPAPPTAAESGKELPPGPAPLDVNDPVAVKGKWLPLLYGFTQLDLYRDSTQSFGAGSNYNLIARPDTYRGDNGRTQLDARNTRFGFKFTSPEVNGLKGTGLLEVDFWGNQPSPAPQYPNSTGVTEQAYYTNPLLRIRHAAVKAETPYVDVLAGLYWNLFGWHLNFIPFSQDTYQVPGGAIARTEQIRLSHLFKTGPVNVEVAAALARPPQRDADVPEGQAGLRFVIDDLKGVGSFPQLSFPIFAQVGVSGIAREFRLPEHVATPTSSRKTSGQGLSLDFRLPLFGGTVKDRRNAANIYGTFITGKGIGDAIGVTGGANVNPVTPPATVGSNATYAQNIDNGIVAWDPINLKYVPIQWTTYLVGLQYHDPFIGNFFITANYGAAKSNNLKDLYPAQTGTGVVGPAGVVPKYQYWNIGLGAFVTQSVSFALGYARTKQTYADDKEAKNSRFILSAFYSFW